MTPVAQIADEAESFTVVGEYSSWQTGMNSNNTETGKTDASLNDGVSRNRNT